MGDVLAFVAVVAVIVVLPGPDMALVLQNGLTGGRRAAVQTAVGINAGLLVWALAAALGVAALLHASGPAFTLLKLAGAAYLVWLGLRALAASCARHGSARADPRRAKPLKAAASRPLPRRFSHLAAPWRGTPAAAATRPRRRTSPFRQGLLTNLLNPKVALVFTTLIPQFVDPGEPVIAQTLLLAAVFICMGLVWLTSYALLVAKVGELLKRSVVRRAVHAVSGTLLTALGVRLAFERR